MNSRFLLIVATFVGAIGLAVPAVSDHMLQCPLEGDVMLMVSPCLGSRTPDAITPFGTINLPDFAFFAASWPPGPYAPCADFNCDGLVSLTDFAIFATHWSHIGVLPAICL